jgi:hypothetical protein
VSDIFREVEEEVRRERLEKLWKEYGDYIVAALALVILAAAGYRLWTYYESRERARASETYLAAQQLLENGQARAAAQEFARLSQTAPRGYARLAQLQAADALLASGKKGEALNLYRQVADAGDEMLSNVARIRAAWILVEVAPKTDVESMLGGLAGPSSPWRTAALEVLAYADLRAGDKTRALSEFQALRKNASAPEGVRRRSDAMATYIIAGGDRDFGKPLYPITPQSIAPLVKTQQQPAHAPQSQSNQTTGKGRPTVTIDTNLPQPAQTAASGSNPPKGQPPK